MYLRQLCILSPQSAPEGMVSATRSRRISAFSVAICTGTFPNRVVMPTTSTSSQLNAAKMAMASSVQEGQQEL